MQNRIALEKLHNIEIELEPLLPEWNEKYSKFKISDAHSDKELKSYKAYTLKVLDIIVSENDFFEIVADPRFIFIKDAIFVLKSNHQLLRSGLAIADNFNEKLQRFISIAAETSREFELEVMAKKPSAGKIVRIYAAPRKYKEAKGHKAASQALFKNPPEIASVQKKSGRIYKLGY